MRDLDAMKLERDGQLAYGTPDRFAKLEADCRAAGHRNHGPIEYGPNTFRCLGCGSFYNGAEARPKRDAAAQPNGNAETKTAAHGGRGDS